MKIVDATHQSFQQDVLNAKGVVLVDFFAPWCGPCKNLAPHLETFAKDFDGKVKVVKVNTEDQERLAVQHNITSIPTLILFKNGRVVDRRSGGATQRDLVAFVQSALR